MVTCHNAAAGHSVHSAAAEPYRRTSSIDAFDSVSDPPSVTSEVRPSVMELLSTAAGACPQLQLAHAS